MNRKEHEEQELLVEGMTCASCVRTVRNYLEGEGLREVYVDLPGKKVSFRPGDDGQVAIEGIRKGIEKLGYRVLDADARPGFFTLERKLVLSALLTLPMLIDHLLHLAGMRLPGLHDPWIQLGLTLPVYLIGFFHFGKSAWGAVRHGESNMDVLIFMGSTAAFVYSLAGLWVKDPSYYFFETAAMIITLVLLGNWLEDRALRGTTTSLDALQDLRVETARLWMGHDQFMDIPAEDLRRGDRVLVRNGEAVPVDGTILEGRGEVDASALTGESLPQALQPGDRLLTGTTVLSGHFVVRADVDAADTLFNQIIRLVKSAQSDKPPIQRLADRISAWFVPLVVGISVLAFFFGLYVLGLPAGKALMNAIAVLVISCPCAMGLATPTAITVGMGRMTRRGLLIRGADTIEELARIRQVLFDKTGTLTAGELKVRQIRSKAGLDAEVRQILYQMELRSTHPLARSIIAYLGNTQVTEPMRLAEIREEPGKGMAATDREGRSYHLGRDDYDGGEGYHLALTRSGEKIGHIVLEDELRPEAPEVVAKFKAMGYAVSLVSGDHEDNVRRVAERTGIADFHSSQLPQDKYALIDRAREKGPLVMVGDGINDAPALERATVGIAMAGASHSALRSARVALLNPQLHDLLELFRLSKLTVRTIRENLFWAFSYNIVAIPLAVMGLLNPMWGAIFMAFSDLVVIGNSLRLKIRNS